MKFEIDIDKLSLQTLGEALRDTVFTEHTGCYSCFDVTDDFIKQSSKDIPLLVAVLLAGCFAKDELERMTYYYSPAKDLHVYWYWDGDGTLVFKLPDDRIIYNSDCKHDDEWSDDTKWAKEAILLPNYFDTEE